MTSYTDEQVLDLIGVCREGPIQAAMNHMDIATILRSLLADRTRLQADVDSANAKVIALRNRLISERTAYYSRHVHHMEHARAMAEGDINEFEQAFDSARAKKGDV